MLDFPNLIKSAIDFGADFLLGDDTYDDDAVNVASTKSRSGGFRHAARRLKEDDGTGRGS